MIDILLKLITIRILTKTCSTIIKIQVQFLHTYKMIPLIDMINYEQK